MAAPVRIEGSAWNDLRFVTLARLMGFADGEHALIKVSRIWSWQTDHYTPDAPTYIVDVDLVESALGVGGAAALVRARLAEEEPDGLRIRGSEGRIEWLYQRRKASARGGEARKRSASRSKKPSGLPPGLPEPDPEQSPLSLAPSPEEEDLSPARVAAAAPPGEEPQRAQRRAITAELWRELGRQRKAIAEELGIEARPLPAVGDQGERALALRLAGARDDRERDELVANAHHAIAVAVAEARATRSVQWLTGALFEDRSWRRAIGMTVEDASRPRASPSSGARQPHDPSPQHPRRMPLL